MKIYLIHNFDDIPSEVLEYEPIIINEGNFKEKKDAYKIKGRFAARKTPFIYYLYFYFFHLFPHS